MRRVVVTGLGILNSLGVGVKHNWANIIAGESGITVIDNFDVSDLPAKIAGQVPSGATALNQFDIDIIFNNLFKNSIEALKDTKNPQIELLLSIDNNKLKLIFLIMALVMRVMSAIY